MSKSFTTPSIDRRNFLKGGALVAGGAAMAGLAGCAPAAQEASAEDAEALSATGGDAAGAVAPGNTVAGSICGEDWLGAMPEIADDQVSETVDVDIVVLGAGHAGCQAALSASQAGAKVAVVEAQPEEEYVCFGDDICAYNSEWVTEQGFGGYDLGDITAEYCRRGLGRVSPAIIKLFVENSGEMFDNMVSIMPDTTDMLDREGGRCIIQTAYGKDKGTDYPVEQSGYKAWATTVQTIQTVNPTEVIPGRRLTRLTEFEHYARLEAERNDAVFYFNTTAEALAMDGEAVVGAYAKKADGSYLKLNASKGVLLATGDFSSNPQMVWNLLTDISEWAARVGVKEGELFGGGRDGMGHKLGCWAGGAIEPHPRPSMNMSAGVPGPWGTSAFLTLNAKGKRFMNEAMAQLSGAAALRQPLGIIACVTDANYMKTVQGAGLDHGAPNWGFPQGIEAMQEAMAALTPGPEGGQVPGVGIAGVNEINTHNPNAEPYGSEKKMGSQVFMADTLEELLGYLGYEGDALQTALDEIAQYNALCKAGRDTDFGKEAELMIPVEKAPFYGATQMNDGTTSTGLVTLGGLITDENLNVMKADRSEPIKGLYAAGNTVGQRYGMAYATPSAGNSMGMAMTHGYMAGKIMAAL
ncbi:MAG: FAD-binding protein [Adlercreutzia sp.]|nr:FAD-binding protein [Adlercreutzia sp.]